MCGWVGVRGGLGQGWSGVGKLVTRRGYGVWGSVDVHTHTRMHACLHAWAAVTLWWQGAHAAHQGWGQTCMLKDTAYMLAFQDRQRSRGRWPDERSACDRPPPPLL